ncbi:hypothetical protein [Cryobacterium sp. M25]|nr:hypothetical protein [Cryobacterium sp. M25]
MTVISYEWSGEALTAERGNPGKPRRVLKWWEQAVHGRSPRDRAPPAYA